MAIITCPKCGNDTSTSSIFCANCGEYLPKELTSTKEVTSTINQQAQIAERALCVCLECGRYLENGIPFEIILGSQSDIRQKRSSNSTTTTYQYKGNNSVILKTCPSCYMKGQEQILRDQSTFIYFVIIGFIVGIVGYLLFHSLWPALIGLLLVLVGAFQTYKALSQLKKHEIVLTDEMRKDYYKNRVRLIMAVVYNTTLQKDNNPNNTLAWQDYQRLCA